MVSEKSRGVILKLLLARNCACNARYVPLQVMDLQVKYHYYTMHTLQDMDLTQVII